MRKKDERASPARVCAALRGQKKCFPCDLTCHLAPPFMADQIESVESVFKSRTRDGQRPLQPQFSEAK